MYTTSARRLYEDQIPSFMSVFDLDQAMQDQDTVTVVDPKMVGVEPKCNPQLPSDPSQLLQPPAIPPNHQHRDSTSTQTSESADSSPTTTVSCTDSSSLSDPSPSSSPDSPVNLVPLNAFPSTNFGGLPSMATLAVSEPRNHLIRPMTSPAPRRPRNMKGLSIQPPFAASAASSSITSEPSSPSFIKPTIPAMKRKPSQLSLKTNSDDLAGRPTLEVPQSPSVPALAQRRALKHSTSSPHMLSGLKSSTFGPAGGMTFPTVFERNESGLSSFLRPGKDSSPRDRNDAILEEDSPIRSQVANRAAFDFEPYHEKESNEDQKSPTYPDGPVAIYGNDVYLYMEPTAEEASRFDVIINVAREVPNPFKETSDKDEPMGDTSPIPDTAVTSSSFATAFEFQPDEMTPTTPKAQFSPKEPEYIHIPWDHNTDIGSDLMFLCETIERKTLAGQKVLVHCQQGASRSASLIIAYGIYQKPEMSVNDAYYAAQTKSKWISPNMRLMYCLQDFQKEVSKRKLPPNSAYKPRSGRRSPSKHRLTLSVDAIDVPKEPRTAPLPDDDIATKSSSPSNSPLRARGNSTPDQISISPGPSSAPSSFSWIEKEDEANPGKFGRFSPSQIFKTPPAPPAIRVESGRGNTSSDHSGYFPKPPPSPGFGSFLPDVYEKPPKSPGFAAHRFGEKRSLGFSPLNFGSFSKPGSVGKLPKAEREVQVVNSLPEDAALMSPRAEIITDNPVHNSFAGFHGLRFVESPPTPNDQIFSASPVQEQALFSPRESTFPRDTFNHFGRPRQVSDPRSPPTKGEAPIIRSIDDYI